MWSVWFRIRAWRRAGTCSLHTATYSSLSESKFGVPPRFIVALWGIETNFGQYLGGFPVIGSLATLAHDGRRSAYFRQELLHALRILEDGHITPEAMVGSWAGAMGQSQFMPSSFVNYAVDYDGDGKRDIWGIRRPMFLPRRPTISPRPGGAPARSGGGK